MQLPNRFIAFTLSIACGLFSCSQRVEQDQVRNSRELLHFNQYLEKTFNLQVPQDSAYFVLINETGCVECVQRSIEHFTSIPKSTLIMTAATQEKYKHILAKSEAHAVMIDATRKINKLRYHGGNIGVLATSNYKIDSILVLDIINMEERMRMFN
jgi:hypothetical protein